MTPSALVEWLAKNKTLLLFVAGACVPTAVIWLKVRVVEKLRKQWRLPPSTHKLLRPPGYSLSLKLDDLWDSLLSRLCAAVVYWGCLFSLMPVGLDLTRYLLVHPTGLVSLVLILLATGLGTGLLIRLARLLNEAQALRLGLRGEQAVGEILAQTADLAYRAFHDLPGDGEWNVDHVCVGPRGVFVLETKTRSKPRDRAGKVQYKVTRDGNRLLFPRWEDRRAIPQAERNARWVAQYLKQKTGEPVAVEALVVIPGWFVEQTSSPNRVHVMNATYLERYLRNQPARLQPAQVQRIVAALEEKCRTLEF